MWVFKQMLTFLECAVPLPHCRAKQSNLELKTWPKQPFDDTRYPARATATRKRSYVHRDDIVHMDGANMQSQSVSTTKCLGSLSESEPPADISTTTAACSDGWMASSLFSTHQTML